MTVTDLRFTPADAAHRESGLIGWLRITLGGAVVVDGLALRRTLGGRLALTWPRKANGRTVVTPVNAESRRRIEDAVFGALAESDLRHVTSSHAGAGASADRVRSRPL